MLYQILQDDLNFADTFQKLVSGNYILHKLTILQQWDFKGINYNT